MNAGKTIFSQLMDCLPWSTFARLVAHHHGDQDVRTFPCTEQYRAMAFAQLAEQPLFCKFPRGVSFGSIAQASMVR